MSKKNSSSNVWAEKDCPWWINKDIAENIKGCLIVESDSKIYSIGQVTKAVNWTRKKKGSETNNIGPKIRLSTIMNTDIGETVSGTELPLKQLVIDKCSDLLKKELYKIKMDSTRSSGNVAGKNLISFNFDLKKY